MARLAIPRPLPYVLGVVALGCSSLGSGSPGAGSPDAADPDAGSPDLGPPALDPAGCPDIFAQDILPTYDVEISADEWAKIEYEFHNRPMLEAAGADFKTYHPIVFRYGSEVVTTALIRLKGKSSWRHAIAYDDPAKMQFVIAFNEVNPKGRFHGVRKIELDMPRNDKTFLRQRLGLAFLRATGIPAQCANSARLDINGRYYGLYTNMERLDKEFLQRVFPESPDGDLWDAGRTLLTNELTASRARRDALFAATDTATIATLVDLPQAVSEWAAEAVMPDGDGYYGGTHNFFLYDHPLRGFLWLPHDKDTALDYRPYTLDPVRWWDPDEDPGRHYRIVLADPVWFDRYVAALERALTVYDSGKLDEWAARWAMQIAAAVREDPNKPFSTDRHIADLATQRAHIPQRAGFVKSWLQCIREGGDDRDGDGFPWCRDCTDADPASSPATVETCANLLDDNCNGLIDEGCP